MIVKNKKLKNISTTSYLLTLPFPKMKILMCFKAFCHIAEDSILTPS